MVSPASVRPPRPQGLNVNSAFAIVVPDAPPESLKRCDMKYIYIYIYKHAWQVDEAKT